MICFLKRHPLVFGSGVFFLFILILGAGALAVSHSVIDTGATEISRVTTVILDPGHGGEDGGAVGVNGVLEKDLNLEVALNLAALLEKEGVSVILTRSDDRLLYGESGNVKGHRKENDLKNRLAFAKEYPEALFVSIHMNTFGEPYYSGLQVYYAATEGSRELASLLQANVKKQLQPQNRRAIQRGDGAIYLLKNAVGCAVLVECGFLSNPEECALLSEKDYRSKLCFSLFCGMMEYINSMTGDAS